MSRQYHRLLIMLALALIASTLPAGRVASDTSPAATTQALVEAADGVAGDLFGRAVALDGDLLLVGALDPSGVKGAAYLYQRDAAAPSGWTQIKKFVSVEVGGRGRFGESVAVQGDVVVVGAPFDAVGDQGAAYIFERDQGGPNNWGLAKQLSESVEEFGDFGSDVALDGDLLLVGAEGAFGQTGAAYLFDRSAGWGKIKELVDPHGVNGDYFGEAVALDGDTVVVGQPMYGSDREENGGAAFVFQRDQGGPNNWGQVTRLVADPSESNGTFGEAVALDGDTIVVGASNEAFGGSHVGAAYVFGRDRGGPNAWGLVKRLVAADGAAFDEYGGAVAIAGDTIWVGEHYSDAGGFPNQGSVYGYGREEGSEEGWGQTAILAADDASANDGFGGNLAVSGTTIAVSATGRSSGRGAVYILSKSDVPASYAVYLPLVMEQYTPPNGILPDGGVFQVSSGAIVGAVEGTLTEPLPVVLVETTAPTQTLDAGAPTGNYYLLAADRVALAPVDKPFLLGLPVPAGVVTEDLAMAVLLPPRSVMDPDENDPMWVASMGHYDAVNNLFVITLSALTPEGLTVVLVSDPVYEPIPLPAAAAARTPVPLPVSFKVECASTGSFSRNQIHNNQPNRDWVSHELERAYVDFVTTLGFKPPELDWQFGEFTGSLQKAPLLGIAAEYYNIQIRDRPCEDNGGGQYIPAIKSIIICLRQNVQPGNSEKAAVRHELFHAIQYAYPNLALDWGNPTGAGWTIEGTATAVERSSYPMQRRLIETRHSIAVPLTDFDNRYRTQDFWVYTALTRRQSVAYLRPIFEAGGTADKIYSALALGDAYWSWVKNQAFEKTEQDIDLEQDADDDFAKPKCELERNLVDQLSLSYPSASDIVGTLAPQQSAVVTIFFEQAAGFVIVAAGAGAQNANLRYKVYDEEGLAGCAQVPDLGRSLYIDAAATVHHVVLSNVSASENLTFEITVGGG